MGRGGRGHPFCLKFRIIFSRIIRKIKSIYIAGKCPSHPFLNFLYPPLNASPLSSEEASLCCMDAGEKKESTRGMMGSPRAFYFSVIAIFIGIPSGSHTCGGERCFIQTSKNHHQRSHEHTHLVWLVDRLIVLVLHSD